MRDKPLCWMLAWSLLSRVQAPALTLHNRLVTVGTWLSSWPASARLLTASNPGRVECVVNGYGQH